MTQCKGHHGYKTAEITNLYLAPDGIDLHILTTSTCVFIVNFKS